MKLNKTLLAVSLASALFATQVVAQNPENPKVAPSAYTGPVIAERSDATKSGKVKKADYMRTMERMWDERDKTKAGWMATKDVAMMFPDVNKSKEAPN